MRLSGKRKSHRMKTLYFPFNFGVLAVVHQIIFALACGLCVQGLNRLLRARHLGCFVPYARFDTIKVKLRR